MKDTDRGLLPVRFAPEEDELFSSWLMRLSMKHFVKLHTFTKFIFPDKQIWNRDIDKLANIEHINLICEQTKCSFQQIFKSTLRAFEGKLYETHNSNGNLSWIMPIGVYRLTRNRFGLQMCPLCLSEDKNPFYRCQWRVSWSTVCLKHNVILLDRCPDCHSPIIFHRGDMGWRNQFVSFSMVQCSICNSLWTSPKIINALIRADSDVILFQSKLESTLTNNWCHLQKVGNIHSISFFNGLKHILRILSVSRRSLKFRERVSSKSKMPLGEIEFAGKQIRSFDYLPIESRYRTIRLGAWLIDGWKERFVETALATGSFSSAFLPYNEIAPFWYYLPIDENLTRKSHPVSDLEIQSALNFLEKQKSVVLPMDLEKLLGKNFFEYKSDKFAISIYERMKRFNETKEKERLREIRIQAQNIIMNPSDYSKTKARHLSRIYIRNNSIPPKHFKKTQRMFDFLITKYKRRERHKIADQMELRQNAAIVAKEFGVAPGTVTKWYRRYKEGGIDNLDECSRTPRYFRHQIVFQKEEGWIRSLHAENMELREIQEKLKDHFNFKITAGGLHRVLNRLGLTLPCSLKNRFVKRNRKKSRERRRFQN